MLTFHLRVRILRSYPYVFQGKYCKNNKKIFQFLSQFHKALVVHWFNSKFHIWIIYQRSTLFQSLMKSQTNLSPLNTYFDNLYLNDCPIFDENDVHIYFWAYCNPINALSKLKMCEISIIQSLKSSSNFSLTFMFLLIFTFMILLNFLPL